MPADEALEVRVVAVGPAHPPRGPVPKLRRVEVPAEVTFEEADGCWNVIEPDRRGR